MLNKYSMNIRELTDKYIQEECDLLKEQWKIDSNFKIYQCLIKLPKDEKAVISFNNDISWIIQSDTSNFKKWQDVYLYDIKKMTAVKFPTHNDIKVAYIFFYHTWVNYSTIFDFSPNSFKQEEIDDYEHSGSKHIANYYNLVFTERIIQSLDEKVINKLIEENYFITPSITPFPTNILLNPKNNFNNFAEELNIFFDEVLVKQMKESWFKNKIFNERKVLLTEAINNYENERFASCISILIPQVEWILREFLFIEKDKKDKTNWKKSYLEIEKMFKDKNKAKVLNDIIETFTKFFNNKTGFFESFNKWTDSLSESFISRHAQSHWKYTEDMYTKENCIRIFLMLFTFLNMIEVINGKDIH